jgi:hypothetical protein
MPQPVVQAKWPDPPAVVTVDVTSAPDRHQPRKQYAPRGSRKLDPVLAGTPRTIIPHTGKSFGAPG